MKHKLIFSNCQPRIAAIVALILHVSSVQAAQLVLQKGHAGQMTRVALSASGTFLASSALDDPIKIWRPRTGEFIRDLPASRDELPLAWSPDGKILLSAARDQNYASPRALPSIRVRSMPTAASFAPCAASARRCGSMAASFAPPTVNRSAIGAFRMAQG